MNNSPSPFSSTLLPANCPFPSHVWMSPNLIQKLPLMSWETQDFLEGRPASLSIQRYIKVLLLPCLKFYKGFLSFGLCSTNLLIVLSHIKTTCRVYTGPSPISCSWPNTYLYLHHMCFVLSELKCYGSATSSSTNHLKCKGKGVMKS
jgi:hypothetical protein